jgi:hypothetical protein
LHRRAGIGEFGLLARPGVERGQFGDGMVEPFAVALPGLERRRGVGQSNLSRPPRGIGRARRRNFARQSAERIEQVAMPARIEQAAIVMLAVDFDEAAAKLAEQRDRHRLVVDESAPRAVGGNPAAEDQRTAVLTAAPIEVVVAQ